MSTREFWNEEPKLLWTYRKMYMDKIKLQSELANQQAWLEGLYFYDALSVSLYNFSRKETQPIQSYMKEPINFNKKPKSQKEIEREQQLEMEERIRQRNRQIKAMLNKKQEVE